MADENKAPQTRDERIAELLDKSGADAVGAIKGPSLSDLTQSEVKTEPKVDESTDEEPSREESGGKKIRIPASRLKTLTSKIEELSTQVGEVQTYKERVAALEAQLKADRDGEELPEWWKEAYGDNDASKQGYKNQQRIMREELKRGLQEQEEQRLVQETERNERIEAIEQSFDDQMDSLEETLGRELTSTQKAELLDIVGEYSPMDGDSYIAYMPVDKAYEIWSKGQNVNPGKQEMARIAGSQSSGGTSGITSSEPPRWGDWRKRF